MKVPTYIEFGQPYRHLGEITADIQYAEYSDGTALTDDEIQQFYSSDLFETELSNFLNN